MLKFECCMVCEPPKRHQACHGTCPEYIETRAEYDRLKDKADHENKVWQGIYRQKCEGVTRALRKHSRIK